MKWLMLGAIVALGTVLIWRGILPALRAVDSDFPNYYTSSRLLLEGDDMSRIYDDAWFNSRIHDEGIQLEGKFSPFPPPTALVMLPFAWLAPLDALRAWTAVNIAALTAVLMLIARLTGKSWQWASVVMLVSGHAIANAFRLGQFYIVLLLALLWGIQCWKNGFQIRAGVMFGLGAAIKYFPLVLVPLMFARRQWKMLAAFTGTIMAVNGVTLFLTGTGVYAEFFRSVLPGHLGGLVQDPFSPVLQSWPSLLRRLFVFDPLSNPAPLSDSPAFAVFFETAIGLAVIACVIIALRRNSADIPGNRLAADCSVLMLAGLALLPASGTYHFVLLAAPAGLLLAAPSGWSKTALRLFAGLYGAIGWIPYHLLTSAGSAHGTLALLLYPRLYFVNILFVLACMRRPMPAGNGSAPVFR